MMDGGCADESAAVVKDVEKRADRNRIMRVGHLFSNRPGGALAVASIALLLAACGRSSQEEPPAGISRFPADLANRELKLGGVFADGWTSPVASLNLHQPDGKQLLVIRGLVPKIGAADYRTGFEVRLDQKVIARRSLGVGEFTLEAQVPAEPGKHRIDLVFSNPQVLPAGDGRAIGARLSFAGFEPADRPVTGADIVGRGAGVQLGSGWQSLETFHNETFRWVTNDAQLVVTAPQGGTRRLAITLASGPGLNGQDFVLQAQDSTGRQVDAVEVHGRQTVELFLPVEAGENNFRLHVDGGGHAAPGKDPRILNFQVIQIDAS
jgi:hypothetical protein